MTTASAPTSCRRTTDRIREVDQVCSAFAEGRSAVVLDNTSAALAFPAATATSAQLHFAIRYSSGFIHAAMPSSRLDQLRVPDQPVLASECSGSRFTAAVDAATGIGTGISARDRARTVRVLADPTSTPDDLVRPGHVLPIRCADRRFGEQSGAWELTSDLVADAGQPPVAVVCRLVRDSGELLVGSAATTFAKIHGLPLLDLSWWAQ